MSRTLTFEHRYAADPDRVFALATDLDTLEAVTRPWVQIHHLPSGPVRQGQVIDVGLSLFSLAPVRPYTIRIEACDATARRMRSVEEGVGVRRLVHDLEVCPDGDGARLIDRVEIEAGWMTPLAAVFARFIYRWRHHVRQKLLAGGTLP